MKLAWQRLEGRDGHSAALALLAELVSPLPEIRHAPSGKPYFAGSDLHFSISHTRHHAFCCVSRTNVGMDAEEMDRTVGPGLLRMLSDTEKARCSDARDPLRLWVLKESYAKATGRGIGNYLKHTDFDPRDPRIQEIDGCFVAVMEEA